MKSFKILIVDEVHPSLFPLLENNHHSYEYQPNISREDLKRILPEYNGIIIRSKTIVDKDLIDATDYLHFVARAGAGLDTIDVDLLRKEKIALLNAPEGNADSLGEHALGLLLALSNNICKSHQEVINLVWDREGNRGTEINGKTVGVIGYGYMGKSASRRYKSIGCQVLAFDKYLKNYTDETVKESSLEEIFEKADVLSLHIPLTPETKGFYNLEFFKKFKKPIFFINTSRGKVVVHKDLLLALEQGFVKAAGLDVFENEKLTTFSSDEKEVFEKLAKNPHVIFTPHIGGWSFESYTKINEVLVNKINHLASFF